MQKYLCVSCHLCFVLVSFAPLQMIGLMMYIVVSVIFARIVLSEQLLTLTIPTLVVSLDF